MDQPDLDATQHRTALRGLARINRLSGSVGILWPQIRALAGELGRDRLRVLDLASGGGDVSVALWRRAQRVGLHLEIVGYDISSTAVEQATRLAERIGAATEFRQVDVLSEAAEETFDIVTCSLFLHHLDERQAIQVLTAMQRRSGHLVLVNDLVRCRRGHLLAHLACRLFSRSQIVHVDGPRSVEGAFSLPEVVELARVSGLRGARIVRRWPCRFLLSWRRPSA